MTLFHSPPNFGLRHIDAGTVEVDIVGLHIEDASSVTINPNTPISLQGIEAPEDGRILWVINVNDVNRMVIEHESISEPVEANRIHTSGLGGASSFISMAPGRSILFRYDGAISRWRLMRIDADFIVNSLTGDTYSITALAEGEMLVLSGGVVTTQAIPGGGGMAWNWRNISTTPTTAAAGDMMWVDASGGDRTVNLPASPAAGNIIGIGREDTGANTVTVDGNGKNINGLASFQIRNARAAYTLGYSGVEWKVW